MEKKEGMIDVRALVQHHPHILMIKLHDVCLALIKEVQQTFSFDALFVSCRFRFQKFYLSLTTGF